MAKRIEKTVLLGMTALSAVVFTSARAHADLIPLPPHRADVNSSEDLQLKNQQAQINQLKRILNDKDSNLEDLQRRMDAHELVLREKEILEAEIVAMDNKLAAKEKAIKNAKDNVAFAQKNQKQFDSLVAEMHVKMAEYDLLKSQNEKYKNMLSEKEALVKELSQKPVELNPAQAMELEAVKKNLAEKEKALSVLSEQVSSQAQLSADQQKIQQELEALKLEAQIKEQELSAAKGNAKFAKEREAELNDMMVELQTVMADYQRLKAEKAELEAQNQSQAMLAEKLQQAQSEKQNLQVNLERLQKQYSDVKEKASSSIALVSDAKRLEMEEKLVAKDLRITELSRKLEKAENTVVMADNKPIVSAAPTGNLPSSALQELTKSLADIQKTLAEEKRQKESDKNLMQLMAQNLDFQMQKVQEKNAELEQRNRNLEFSLQAMAQSVQDTNAAANNLRSTMLEQGSMQRNAPAALSPSVQPLKETQDEPSILTPMPPENAGSVNQPVAVAEPAMPTDESIFAAEPPPAQSPADLLPPLEYAEDEVQLTEAQRLERQMMADTAAPAQAAPQNVMGDITADRAAEFVAPEANFAAEIEGFPAEPMPVRPPAPTISELADVSTSKIYFEPSVHIYGLLQAADGYVPDTYGLLSELSDETKLVFQWHEGDIYSSAEQKPILEQDFDELTMQYLVQTEERCAGDFAAIPVSSRDIGDIRVDSYDIACIMGDDGFDASASIMFFNYGETFSSISYETLEETASIAMDKREKLIKTLEDSTVF